MHKLSIHLPLTSEAKSYTLVQNAAAKHVCWLSKYVIRWEKGNMKEQNKLCGMFNYIPTQTLHLSFSPFPLDLAFTAKDQKLFSSQGSSNDSELI